MIKALFFDLAGVLVNDIFRSGINSYAEDYNLPYNEVYEAAHKHPYWSDYTLGKITKDEYLKEVSKNFPAVFNSQAFVAAMRDSLVENEYLLRRLDELKNDYLLGIISNHPVDFFELYNEKLDFHKMFSICVISGEVHLRKPDPRIFEIAIERTKFKPQQCIYVDDRLDKTYGAEEIGMKVIKFVNNEDFLKQLTQKI